MASPMFEDKCIIRLQHSVSYIKTYKQKTYDVTIDGDLIKSVDRLLLKNIKSGNDMSMMWQDNYG